MKVIIAGCRDRHAYTDEIDKIVTESGFKVDELVCGMAPGIDHAGHRWATDFGVRIVECPADWKSHGKAAGPIRNRKMAEYADALIAVWDGKSRGTKNMIDTMRGLGKPVHVHMI